MPAPLSRFQPTIKVFIEGQESTRAALLTASAGVMSRDPDQCTFELRDLDSKQSTELQNRAIDSLMKNDLCEVHVSTRGGGWQVVHYGRVVEMDATIDNGETIVYTSRLDDHLFGFPVERVYIGERDIGQPDTVGFASYTPLFIDGETTFNPVFDGITTPNRSAGTIVGPVAHIFIDPGSVNAELLHEDRKLGETGADGAVVGFWSVAQAATYLCWTLNASEAYVKNPSLAECEAAIGTDWADLRNHTVDIGDFLPRALDALLWARGFGWRIIYTTQGRKIQLYKRGAGTEKVFKLQSWGSPLNTDETHLARFNANMDYSDGAANHFVVLGGFKEYEVSIVLRPGWSTQYDGLTGNPLRRFNRNAPDWENNVELQRAWRLYVANEAGQYTDTRLFWTQALDIGEFLDEPRTILRRRRLYPTISLDKSGAAIGKQQGVFLEYYDPAGQKFKPTFGGDNLRSGLQSGQFQILEDEIGIWFTDFSVPQTLMTIGRRYGMENLILRVTGTIRSDVRMRGIRRDVGGSFLVDSKQQIIEAHEQFQYREIIRGPRAGPGIPIGGSIFNPNLTGEADGIPGAEQYAQDLLDRYNAANLSGNATIEGVDWQVMDYLGSPVTKIQGRELRLLTNPATVFPQYPQVTRVEFDIQKQTTTLNFEALR